MTVFELVRQEVTAEAVARLYGLKFGRNVRAVCPWHSDHHPDLAFSLNGTAYCHACHAGGDAVALAAQILGLTPKEAAERLRSDFHLDQPSLGEIATIETMIQRLERQIRRVFGPRLIEIPVFRCAFEDGAVEDMTALEFAYAVQAEGRSGQVCGRVGTRWEPVKSKPEAVDFKKLFEEAQQQFEQG